MNKQVRQPSIRPQSSLEPQVKLGLITAVVVGYVAHFISISTADAGEFPFTLITVVVAIFMGVIYVFVELRQLAYFARFSSKWTTPLFFFTQLMFLLIIQFLLAVELFGGIWLVPLPLVPTVVRRLKPRWRWLIYASIVAVVVLPLGIRFGDWSGAMERALLFSPALLLMTVYSGLLLREQAARERAEQLAAQVDELATLRERNRITHEIHDMLGDYFTAVHVQLEVARAMIASDVNGARGAMERAQDLTRNGLTAVRQSVSTLRDSAREK